MLDQVIVDGQQRHIWLADPTIMAAVRRCSDRHHREAHSTGDIKPFPII